MTLGSRLCSRGGRQRGGGRGGSVSRLIKPRHSHWRSESACVSLGPLPSLPSPPSPLPGPSKPPPQAPPSSFPRPLQPPSQAPPSPLLRPLPGSSPAPKAATTSVSAEPGPRSPRTSWPWTPWSPLGSQSFPAEPPHFLGRARKAARPQLFPGGVCWRLEILAFSCSAEWGCTCNGLWKGVSHR